MIAQGLAFQRACRVQAIRDASRGLGFERGPGTGAGWWGGGAPGVPARDRGRPANDKRQRYRSYLIAPPPALTASSVRTRCRILHPRLLAPLRARLRRRARLRALRELPLDALEHLEGEQQPGREHAAEQRGIGRRAGRRQAGNGVPVWRRKMEAGGELCPAKPRAAPIMQEEVNMT